MYKRYYCLGNRYRYLSCNNISLTVSCKRKPCLSCSCTSSRPSYETSPSVNRGITKETLLCIQLLDVSPERSRETSLIMSAFLFTYFVLSSSHMGLACALSADLPRGRAGHGSRVCVHKIRINVLHGTQPLGANWVIGRALRE